MIVCKDNRLPAGTSAEVSVKAGESLNLATVDTYCKNLTGLTYTSGDKSVLTMDGSKATGVKEGKVTVTVTDADKNPVFTFTVNVTKGDTPTPSKELSGIRINEKTLAVEEGKTITVTATLLPEGVTAYRIFWISEAKDVFSVDENGVITGKGLSYGGSLIRPEATGYGAIYYTCEVFKHQHDDIKGKTFVVSGFGNVAWGAIKKITALGGKALTISGPDGYVYDPDGIATEEKINYLLEMRASGRDRVQDYADKFGAEFHPGEKPWGVKGDVILPCATQNEVTLEDAKKIVANGAKYYIEVSNMPTTADALNYLMDQKNLIVAPSKAVNAGGVCVSGLEMSQNSQRLSWTAEEVDAKLHQAMINIHKHSVEAAERYGLGYNLVAGANIAGFEKVADAMLAQGIY